MERLYLTILVMSVITTNTCNACPTCVGRVAKESAPFFSNECYSMHITTTQKAVLDTRQKNAELGEEQDEQSH